MNEQAKERRWHGLAIELKRKKGGRLTPEQRLWLTRLGEMGYYAVCCKGGEAAWHTVEQYLAGNL